jgi:hypothetical protein
MPILLASPHQQFAPSGASLPPLEHVPFKKAPSVALPKIEPSPSPATASHMVTVAPAPRVPAEIVESLTLPEGLSESMLAPDARPRTPAQARIAMTRLSRGLGRDYRLWYGTTLITSVVAIESMQRHLRRRFDDKAVAKDDGTKVLGELMRHGALLSEILARSLGGVWADVTVDEPGRWAMALHADIRVWPIGRVYRFFQQGNRETDLVAFYLDLENQVQKSA